MSKSIDIKSDVTLPIAVSEWFVCASYSLQNDYIGKFLTIVDSAIADKEQRKAIKDIVKQIVQDNDRIRHVGECLQLDLENITEPNQTNGRLYDDKIPELMELDYEYIRKDK